MSDNKKGSEAYKVLPGWPFQILGVLCLVIGYFCLYPIHFSRPSWMHWPDWKFELPDPPKFTAPQSPNSGTAEAGPSTNPELERVKRLPRSSERPFSFEPQRKVFETDLEAGVWSREIVLPPNTKLHYRVDVTPGGGRFFIWYKDGFVGEVTNEKEIEKFGVRYGIFRILAEQPGRKVTVTITN